MTKQPRTSAGSSAPPARRSPLPARSCQRGVIAAAVAATVIVSMAALLWMRHRPRHRAGDRHRPALAAAARPTGPRLRRRPHRYRYRRSRPPRWRSAARRRASTTPAWGAWLGVCGACHLATPAPPPRAPARRPDDRMVNAWPDCRARQARGPGSPALLRLRDGASEGSALLLGVDARNVRCGSAARCSTPDRAALELVRGRLRGVVAGAGGDGSEPLRTFGRANRARSSTDPRATAARTAAVVVGPPPGRRDDCATPVRRYQRARASPPTAWIGPETLMALSSDEPGPHLLRDLE